MIQKKKKIGRPKLNQQNITIVTKFNREKAHLLTGIARRYKRSRSAHIAIVLEKYIQEDCDGKIK